MNSETGGRVEMAVPLNPDVAGPSTRGVVEPATESEDDFLFRDKGSRSNVGDAALVQIGSGRSAHHLMLRSDSLTTDKVCARGVTDSDEEVPPLQGTRRSSALAPASTSLIDVALASIRLHREPGINESVSVTGQSVPGRRVEPKEPCLLPAIFKEMDAPALWYLTPALHAAAKVLNPGFRTARKSVWGPRTVTATKDFQRWVRLSMPLSQVSWTSMVAALAEVCPADILSVNAWIGTGRISGRDAQKLLKVGLHGRVHASIHPLVQWVLDRIGDPVSADEATSALREERESRLEPVAAPRTASAVDGELSGRDPVSAQQSPAVRKYRRVGDGDPQPLPRLSSARQDPSQCGRNLNDIDRGDPERPTAASCELLMEELASKSAQQMWTLVDESRTAATRGVRRHLPGSLHSRHAGYSASLATEILRGIFVALKKNPNSASLQVVAWHFPTIFLRRGVEIAAQAKAVQSRTSLPHPPAQDHDARQQEPIVAWTRKLAAAHADGDNRTVVKLLEGGFQQEHLSQQEAEVFIQKLFPAAIGETEDEPGEWEEVMRRAAASDPMTLSEWAAAGKGRKTALLRWARSHRSKAGDRFGWSGQLIMDIHAKDDSVTASIADLFFTDPRNVTDIHLRSAIFRESEGYLIPTPGRPKPRPIAAPTISRRVVAARDMRSVRAVTKPFCADRGHVGLSGGSELLAYSMFPNIVASVGGNVIVGDRADSYQNFRRDAILSGVSAGVDFALEKDNFACAKILAKSAANFLVDGGALFRTAVAYRKYDVRPVAHSLSQGCSLSPTVQSLVLAACVPLRAPGQVGAAQPDVATGVSTCRPPLMRGAHDDLWIVSVDPRNVKDMRLPPTTCGGEYNPMKSGALGPYASRAVESGQASSARLYLQIFGCPAGDVGEWARSVWLPKYRRVVHNIRSAAGTSPEAAASAAHAVGGPGAYAAHWIRAVPQLPADALEVLRAADAMWLAMWAALAGCGGGLSVVDADNLRDRVFGEKPACFGHMSAVDAADMHRTAGIVCAWSVIAKWSKEAGMPPAMIVSGIGAPRHVLAGASWESATALWAEDQAGQAQEEYQSSRQAMAARVTTGTRDPGPRRDVDGDVGRPNWLVSWMTPCPSVFTGPSSPDPRGAKFLIARSLGLPVWGALGMVPPAHCPHCEAVRVPSAHGGGLTGGGGVTKLLDDYGEHILCCTKSGPAAGGKARHDRIVSTLALISEWSGCDGRVHDVPLFSIEKKLRPADFLEWDAHHSGGGARDLTLGTRSVMTAAVREQDKWKKYRAPLAEHPHLGFAPLGFDLSGDVGGDAWGVVAQWGRSRVSRCAREGIDGGNALLEIVGAVSRTLARGVANQAAAWCAVCVAGGKRGWLRARGPG
jgi:hypothetical protein